MAESYNHAVTSRGKLRSVMTATEIQGDAYETTEEMYGMLWYLANGDADLVENARRRYREGINRFSPGVQGHHRRRVEDGE